MTNEELINGLRWCADESICCDDFSGEKCPYFDEKKDSCSVDEILHAAADALEAAEKRIATYQSDVADLEQREKELNDVLNERARLITELQSRIAELEAEMKRKDKEFEKMASDATEYEADLRERIEELVTKCHQLEAQLPKEGEWNSVKEILPNNQRPVIVYVPEHSEDDGEKYVAYIGVAYYTWSPKGGFWCGTDGDTYGAIGIIHEPTAWMELPEPPNCGAKMKGEEK